jgi:hypothetical protein
MRKSELKKTEQKLEFEMGKVRERKWEVGSGTRRRPIQLDYAGAKDAEVGKNGKEQRTQCIT